MDWDSQIDRQLDIERGGRNGKESASEKMRCVEIKMDTEVERLKQGERAFWEKKVSKKKKTKKGG